MLYRQAFLSAVFMATGLVTLLSAKSPSCNEVYRNDRQVQVGSQTIEVQVARTPFDLHEGLGGRACIGKDRGMLFTFNNPGDYIIWMRNMHFPIDIIWINQDKEVVQVASNVFPFTYPEIFVNSKPASYILELKAGQVRSFGIKENTSLKFY